MRVEKANWNPVTEAYIASALTTSSMEDMKDQVEEGAQLFKVVDQYVNTIAAFILRIDYQYSGDVGVIVAAGGRAGFDLTKHVLPYIETMFLDVRCVRIHTQRVGLVKKLMSQGYAGVEYVLEKGLNNGRR